MTRQALIVPTLSSERLRLEPLSLDHSAGMFSLWREVEVCRFAGAAHDFEGRPIALPAESAADSDRIIDFFARSRAAGRGFRWALICLAKKRMVGAAGFNTLGRCSEYAYHLHPDFWGLGYMGEASLVALGWLWSQPGRAEAEVFIDAENRASVRLSTRLGFRATGESSGGVARYSLAAPTSENSATLDFCPPGA